MAFDAGAGWVSWINMPTSTTLVAGDVLAYSAQIDSQDLFTVYTEAAGSSDPSIKNFRTVVGSSTAAILTSTNIPFGSQVITNGALCVGATENGQDCDDTQLVPGQILSGFISASSTSNASTFGGGLISSASSTFMDDFLLVGSATTTGTIDVQGLATSTFTGGVAVSSGSIALTGLSNCDTIDTDTDGILRCGSDNATAGGVEHDIIFSTLGGTNYYQASTSASTNLTWQFNNGFVSNASSTINGDFIVTGDATTTGLGYFLSGLISSASSTFSSTLEVQDAIGASSTLAVTGISTFANSTTTLLVDTTNNQIGIGTSTLYGLFNIWDDNSDTLNRSLFSITNHASSTLFSVDDGGNATTSGAFSASSLFGASGADFIVSAAGTVNNLLLNPYGGNVGVGTSSPSVQLAVQNTVSSPQFRIGYDDTRYGDLQVNSAGDLVFNSYSGNISAMNNNLYVCTGSSCPTLLDDGSGGSGSSLGISGNGNVQVESALYVGNFKIAPTTGTTTALSVYDNVTQAEVLRIDNF